MEDTDQCDTCNVVDKIYPSIESTIHDHLAYKGPAAVCKAFFKGLDGNPIKMCKKCIAGLLLGMIHGHNYRGKED